MERKIYKQGYGLKPMIPDKDICPLEEEKNTFFETGMRSGNPLKGCMIRNMNCAKNMKALREKS